MIFRPELGKELLGRKGIFLTTQVRFVAAVRFLKPSVLNGTRVGSRALLDAIEERHHELGALLDWQ